MKHGARALALLSLALPLVGGCVQRTIHVTSEPSGALVHLNDQEVGRTPVSVPFTFYGVYDVRVEAQGHAPLWAEREAAAPWWEYPGPDLVAEAIPGARSDVRWHFELEPYDPQSTDPDALIDRARQLRATANEPAERR